MTDEDLKYYKALQQVFKWIPQTGDAFYYRGNLYFFSGDGYCCYQDIKDRKNIIWLPLPIDTEHPERGLCGMLNNISSINPVYDLCAAKIKYWEVSIEPGDTKTYYYKDNTPTLALLKALAAQEGIEV